MKLEIDSLDRRILNQLQQDNRITNVELAEIVGLSPPACLKRVQRLRSAGAIESDVAILNPKICGKPINIIVEVEMERDRPELYRRFAGEIQKSPEVTQCYQVTGEIDMVLILSVQDMEEFQRFVERVMYAETNIRKFRTLISMKREKFTTALPI